MDVRFCPHKEGWEILSRGLFLRCYELDSKGQSWFADIREGVTKDQITAFLLKEARATGIRFSEEKVRNGPAENTRQGSFEI